MKIGKKRVSVLQTLRRISQLSFFILLFVSFYKMNFQTIVIVILVLTAIGGVWYCGWMCPFGAVQELLNNIRSTFFKGVVIPRKVHRFLVGLRYLFFGLVTFAGIYLLYDYDARLNFISYLYGSELSYVMIGSVIVFIVLSFIIDRPFCNYFCVEGAKYGLYSIFRIFTVKRNNDECIDCKICDKNCPMNINISDHKEVRSLQCVNCFSCVSKCPKSKALNYGFIDLKGYWDKIVGIFK